MWYPFESQHHDLGVNAEDIVVVVRRRERRQIEVARGGVNISHEDASPRLRLLLRSMREQTLVDVEVALSRLQIEVGLCAAIKGRKIRRRAIRDIAKLLVLKEELMQQIGK